jgi:hypothetical protein
LRESKTAVFRAVHQCKSEGIVPRWVHARRRRMLKRAGRSDDAVVEARIRGVRRGRVGVIGIGAEVIEIELRKIANASFEVSRNAPCTSVKSVSRNELPTTVTCSKYLGRACKYKFLRTFWR